MSLPLAVIVPASCRSSCRSSGSSSRARWRSGQRARYPQADPDLQAIATLLLLAVVGWPETSFARLTIAGILLSLVGDVACCPRRYRLSGWSGGLPDRARHLHVANVGVAVCPAGSPASPRSSWRRPLWLLRYARPPVNGDRIATNRLWRGDQRDGDHPRGPRSGARCAGRRWRRRAVLFYVSDASSRSTGFTGPSRTCLSRSGVYWVGQLGIALAARGPVG